MLTNLLVSEIVLYVALAVILAVSVWAARNVGDGLDPFTATTVVRLEWMRLYAEALRRENDRVRSGRERMTC